MSKPHINVKFVWSLYLLFCPYVHHDTKIYKSSTNLRGTFAAFKVGLVHCFVRQRSKKQVYQLLMNNNFT